MDLKLACPWKTEGNGEGCYSDIKSLTSGVPQQSLLGPLWSVIYVYLDKIVGGLIDEFADDANIVTVIESLLEETAGCRSDGSKG